MGVKLLMLFSAFSSFGKKAPSLHQNNSLFSKNNLIISSFNSSLNYIYRNMEIWGHNFWGYHSSVFPGAAFVFQEQKNDLPLDTIENTYTNLQIKSFTYEHEKKKFCNGIKKIFDKDDPTKVPEILEELKEYKTVCKKHPSLEKLITKHTDNPTMMKLYQDICAISDDEFPDEIVQIKNELEEKITNMPWHDRVFYFIKLSSKFKK